MHDVETDEIDGDRDPRNDPRITGDDAVPDDASPPGRSGAGQARQPFEYGEILEAAGIVMTEDDVAVHYYRTRALPYLVPFPRRRRQMAAEPLVAALEPWDIGDPLDQIDWAHSMMLSPRPIPGSTLVRRNHDAEPAREREAAPVDLDLYVDSSGSMPDPQRHVSHLALAGAIVALSALRAGASVQATLWSGKGQVVGTEGFVRDEHAILRVVTGFFGGATCFPLHRLRETYAVPEGRRRATHIMMISDDGITTMFDKDERGRSGWDIAAAALRRAGAGGTMALNLPLDWPSSGHGPLAGVARDLLRARDEQGWDVHAVPDMAQLVAFAHAFSHLHYDPRRGLP